MARLGSHCSCPQRRRRLVRSGDRRLARLRKRMEQERRRAEQPVAEMNRKQDHCMADVKMNCFRLKFIT